MYSKPSLLGFPSRPPSSPTHKSEFFQILFVALCVYLYYIGFAFSINASIRTWFWLSWRSHIFPSWLLLSDLCIKYTQIGCWSPGILLLAFLGHQDCPAAPPRQAGGLRGGLGTGRWTWERLPAQLCSPSHQQHVRTLAFPHALSQVSARSYQPRGQERVALLVEFRSFCWQREWSQVLLACAFLIKAFPCSSMGFFIFSVDDELCKAWVSKKSPTGWK